MKFDDLFNDSETENFQHFETFDIKNQVLSPPISMPSNSLKNNYKDDDFLIQNDSEVREALFLKRMQNNLSNISSKNQIEKSSIKFDQKPIQKSQIYVSNVKLRLNSIPKTDEDFLKRSLSRRIKKLKSHENFKTFTPEPFDKNASTDHYEVNPLLFTIPRTSQMPLATLNKAEEASTSNDFNYSDQKFKFALKNMLPIPSNSEQQILLDEYKTQLTQFSIAIHRIITDEKSDENCVYLLRLMAGLYTVLKTALLGPSVYKDLFERVGEIERDARSFIQSWAAQEENISRQQELFELAWWCESALPRAYLVTLVFSSLPQLWEDKEALSNALAACKAVQHPLKGTFLYSRMHGLMKYTYFSSTAAANERQDQECMKSLCLGYSIEIFTTLLKYFCRWHQSLPAKTTEAAYISSLFDETFAGYFGELASICRFDEFEAMVLPTILVEVVNCGDSLAQNLIFSSIVKEFDEKFLFSQLGPLIKSSSQFAQGTDLKGLLDQLFRKVQAKQFHENDTSIFDSIWEETSKLIKNRCEIDQCDTVIISSLMLSLLATSSDDPIKPIEIVLEFLIKMLKSLRPGGFDAENSNGVGAEIVYLIKNMMNDFNFTKIVLKLENLPKLLDCLKPSSARRCALTQIISKLPNLNETPNFVLIVRLFDCFTRRDLVQLLDNNFDLETVKLVTEDLKEFTTALLNASFNNPKSVESLFDAFDSPSSALNLFLIPELLERLKFSDTILSKKLIKSLLQNTSNVLPHRLEITEEEVSWIAPEFTKLTAVQLYLKLIETAEDEDLYELYTEILTILSYYVSHDYLKIQIIDSVLETFKFSERADRLRSDDFNCLLDHLSKESCQLLKKIDRCELLLRIHEISNTFGNDGTVNSNKYMDQILVLLGQLSAHESEHKCDFAMKYLSFILNCDGRRLQGEEEALYQWTFDYVTRVDSKKEIQFYDIKMKYDLNNSLKRKEEENEQQQQQHQHQHQQDEVEENESVNIDDNLDEFNLNEAKTNFGFNEYIQEESTLEDLQKLKIFASFQME